MSKISKTFKISKNLKVYNIIIYDQTIISENVQHVKNFENDQHI